MSPRSGAPVESELTMDLQSARALRDAAIQRRTAPPPPRTAPPSGTLWRPTPTPVEADRMAAGTLTMLKVWDTSPISPDALDPTLPPSPDPPPATPPRR
jgi:hypothetical protein